MANLTDADKVLRNDTGKDIASKLDAIKTAIQNQSTTLNNLADVSILSVQDGQFLKYNSTEQKWENVSLPDPMVFKGTLGTGGTITDLPVDGSANVGDTYKVIEDGTYATVSAKVGDLFSCLTKTSVANTWVLIPSGDESFTDTWRGIKVNGTEKLASSISSGEVDFVEGSNVQITFDTTGNKIIISATDTTYSEATQSTSGLMSASDKTKLDTMPTTADTQPITSGSAVNTKEYIDDKTTLVKSASGSLIHITDGGDNIPLKACEITIAPDLTGYTEARLYVCGKNLLPMFTPTTSSGVDYTVDNNGVVTASGQATGNSRIGQYLYLPAGDYVLSGASSGSTLGVGDTYVTRVSDGVVIARDYTGSTDTDKQFTLTQTERLYIACRFVNAATTSSTTRVFYPQIERGETSSDYTPYNCTTYNIPFGQTVYGGSGNALTGEFEKTWDTITYDGSADENWNYESGRFNIINNDIKSGSGRLEVLCNEGTFSPTGSSEGTIFAAGSGGTVRIYYYAPNSITTVEAFKTWLGSNNMQVVFQKATPTSLSLTPVSPKTISGVNNIYNNCGATNIEYFTSSADEESELIEVKTYSKSEVDTKLADKEDKATVLSGTLTAGQTSITFTNNAITTDSIIQIFVDTSFSNVWWNSITLSTGSLTISFPAQSSDMPVKVRLL